MTDAKAQWRESMRTLLQRDVEIFANCSDDDLMTLARTYPGYTGYTDSTPIASWTPEQRRRRRIALHAGAVRKLRAFERSHPDPGAVPVRKAPKPRKVRSEGAEVRGALER
ncbi:MAG: hypothetical protein WAU89_21800, partial [Candidatus Acidiferrales bacterium]